MLLVESCSLELSAVHMNPKETEEVIASDSSKDASSSGVSMESVRMESRPC